MIQSNLLLNNIRDKAGDDAIKFSTVLPTISASYAPFKNRNLRLRSFIKSGSRQPAFNDLYYTLVGNLSLKPERTIQANLGFTAYFPSGEQDVFSFTTDIYHNHVRDKIVAMPRLNLYQWSMMNIGKAIINGLDLNVDHRIKIKNIAVRSAVNYSLQQARDVTDATSVVYNKQLAYTPLHSGSMFATASFRQGQFTYNSLFSGNRYINAEALPAYLLKAYWLHNIHIGYDIKLKAATCLLMVEINNFTGRNYEVVKYYPMPGRQYRLSILYQLNKTK